MSIFAPTRLSNSFLIQIQPTLQSQLINSNLLQVQLINSKSFIMEKAKKAVSNFLSKDGKHDTTIDQDVRDPVVKEQVRPQRHEEIITAVDQEIHQDHHQTVVQPLATKETL